MIETIATKAGKDTDSRTIAVGYDFGNDLAGAVALFGEEAVFNCFKADGKVGLQAFVRSRLNATEEDSEAPKYSDEEITTAVADWKPGNKSRTASDPMAKLQALLGKLTAEQKAALIANLD